jgi:hypothetical protein
MVSAARTRLIGQVLANTEIAVHLNVEPRATVNLRRPTPIHGSALQPTSTYCSPSDPFWQQQLSVTAASLSHGSRPLLSPVTYGERVTVDYKSPVPPHRQVAQFIRDRIRAG